MELKLNPGIWTTEQRERAVPWGRRKRKEAKREGQESGSHRPGAGLALAIHDLPECL